MNVRFPNILTAAEMGHATTGQREDGSRSVAAWSSRGIPAVRTQDGGRAFLLKWWGGLRKDPNIDNVAQPRGNLKLAPGPSWVPSCVTAASGLKPVERVLWEEKHNHDRGVCL